MIVVAVSVIVVSVSVVNAAVSVALLDVAELVLVSVVDVPVLVVAEVGKAKTYAEPEEKPTSSSLLAPTTATVWPNQSPPAPSAARSFRNCAPLAPSKTYAEPVSAPASSFPWAPTTTRAPLELTVTEAPNSSYAAPSAARSFSSRAPQTPSKTYAEPKSEPGSSL